MLLLEPVHASPCVGWQMDPASSSDSSHPSSVETWEALSSHLHRLQLSHELLESRVRVAEDRLLILSREQRTHQLGFCGLSASSLIFVVFSAASGEGCLELRAPRGLPAASDLPI